MLYTPLSLNSNSSCTTFNTFFMEGLYLNRLISQTGSTLRSYYRFNDEANLDGSLVNQLGPVNDRGLNQCSVVGQNFEFENHQLGDRHAGKSLLLKGNTYLEISSNPAVFTFVGTETTDFSIEFVCQYIPSYDDTIAPTGEATRTVLSKPGLVSVTVNIGANGGVRSTTVHWPTGIKSKQISILNATSHIAITWNVSVVAGVKTCTGLIYVNGRVIKDLSIETTVGSSPASAPSPLYILGAPSSSAPSTTWKGSIAISDLAIYNETLSQEELLNRCELLYLYPKFIQNLGCSYYNTFSILDKDGNLEPTIGTQAAELLGAYTTNIQHTVPDWRGGTVPTIATKIGDGTLSLPGGVGIVTPCYVQASVIPLVDGICYTHKSHKFPYTGIAVSVNHSVTTIDFGKSNKITFNNAQVSTGIGKVLTIGLLVNEITTSVFINGYKAYTIQTDYVASSANLAIGAVVAGSDRCVESIALELLVAYTEVNDAIALAMQTYNKTYRVSGSVVEQGVPAKSVIRVYDSATGLFIKSQVVDSTGAYTINLSTAALVDLVIISSKTDRARTILSVCPR